MFEDRVPANGRIALTWVLPMHVLLYAQAVLVQLPHTRLLRLALLPCGLYFMYQCAWIDNTALYPDELRPRVSYFNLGNVTIIVTNAMRFVTFGVASQPYRRIGRSDSTSEKNSKSTNQLLRDAGDLLLNARGIGWNWGTTIPTPPLRTTLRWRLIKQCIVSFVLHILVIDALIHVIHTLNPALSDPEGASIYLPTNPTFSVPTALSWVTVHLTHIIITFCVGIIIYAGVVYPYEAVRIVALLLGGDPVRWPAAFDAPWAATSLKDLWGRRWHQIFRHAFTSLGALPSSVVAGWVGNRIFGRAGGKVVGRAAGLLGGFALSTCLHEWGLWGMGRGGDLVRVSVFFTMMAVGIALEDGWRRASGRRVGGVSGWLWTFGWLIGWGHLLVEAYCRKGLTGQVWARVVTFTLQYAGVHRSTVQ